MRTNNNKITVEDLAKIYPKMYKYNYKWTDSERDYEDLNDVLFSLGFQLINPNISGAHNDLESYYNCEIIPVGEKCE